MHNDFTPVIKTLNLDLIPKMEISYRWLHIASNGIGQPILVPIIIAKGNNKGKVLGLTAVVHGNELNGMSVIQKVFNSLELDKLSGTLVGVPVVNVPSILNYDRLFIDGTDINRIMPGKINGNRSEVYSHRIVNRIVKHFDFLLDLHTASFGRINSFYIRADLKSKTAYELANLQNPEIILNAPPKDGTLRGAAAELGIEAITIEVGDPDKFQTGMIKSGLQGVYNTMVYLGMYSKETTLDNSIPVTCEKSLWLYTDMGGILQVLPSLTQRIKKGELIATLRDVFGRVIKEYNSPYDGIVIGKSVNPVSQTGSRIIHLGLKK